MDIIEKMIDEEGFYISNSSGMSMYPLLRNRKDTIVVRKKEDGYKKYDIVLYKRNHQYILHRIIRVQGSRYIIRGDNCYCNEYDIDENKIIGYLDECYRGEKRIDLNGIGYKIYVFTWIKSYPVRYFIYTIRRHFSKKRNNKKTTLGVK